ncbi:MAG: CARDB domain-containing protein [Anaerolineae bacterium]
MNLNKGILVRILRSISIAAFGLVSLLLPVLADASLPSASFAVAAEDYPNCRFGVGVANNPITTYNYTQTRAGWYINWGANATPPNDLDFYHTLRVRQDKLGSTYLPTYVITPALNYDSNGLGAIVETNPGHIWIIGNEPERSYYQDETLPDMYAQVYHDAYVFIKAIDPTARVAIGGVIQPTPLRLQYLDKVLTAYQLKFGGAMPIDVWNVHMYILQEVAGSWGASIPVGISATLGVTYTPPQSLDIGIFSSLVLDMRRWMKARGYQDTPLVITEYGVLFPLRMLNEGYGLTQTDIDRFINDSITYLDIATDTSLGYPPDGYRLVQQAAFYSLDDDSVDDFGDYRWGSFIYNSTPPYNSTSSGTRYISTLKGMPARVDLLPAYAASEPATLLTRNLEPITATLKVAIANAGNSRLSSSITVRFWEVISGGYSQLYPDSVITQMMNGCGTMETVSLTMPNLSIGAHSIRVEVDPDHLISELRETNNIMTVTLVVGSHASYLPVIRR